MFLVDRLLNGRKRLTYTLLDFHEFLSLKCNIHYCQRIHNLTQVSKSQSSEPLIFLAQISLVEL